MDGRDVASWLAGWLDGRVSSFLQASPHLTSPSPRHVPSQDRIGFIGQGRFNKIGSIYVCGRSRQ